MIHLSTFVSLNLFDPQCLNFFFIRSLKILNFQTGLKCKEYCGRIQRRRWWHRILCVAREALIHWSFPSFILHCPTFPFFKDSSTERMKDNKRSTGPSPVFCLSYICCFLLIVYLLFGVRKIVWLKFESTCHVLLPNWSVLTYVNLRWINRFFVCFKLSVFSIKRTTIVRLNSILWL